MIHFWLEYQKRDLSFFVCLKQARRPNLYWGSSGLSAGTDYYKGAMFSPDDKTLLLAKSVIVLDQLCLLPQCLIPETNFTDKAFMYTVVYGNHIMYYPNWKTFEICSRRHLLFWSKTGIRGEVWLPQPSQGHG